MQIFTTTVLATTTSTTAVADSAVLAATVLSTLAVFIAFLGSTYLCRFLFGRNLLSSKQHPHLYQLLSFAAMEKFKANQHHDQTPARWVAAS